MKKIIVIGSGGHAKVVIDILSEMRANGQAIEIFGVTSNSLEINQSFCGYPVLGDDEIIKKYLDGDYYAVMGLGGYTDNKLRAQIFNYVKNMGMVFINVIHPSAVISKTAILGEAVVIFPGVIINTEASIGNNSIIATGASIDHETIIEENVLVSAGVTVGAYSRISKGALLALGSKVISGVIVGSNVLVASGAVVVNNIADNKRVFGIPAKEKNASHE